MVQGSEDFKKVIKCANNQDRLAEEVYPIGSGDVEAANKLLVVQRLKRSGQSWRRDGGQPAGPFEIRSL